MQENNSNPQDTIGGDAAESAPTNSEDTVAALSCFRCGVCCMKYQVQVDAEEASRIAGYLGLPDDEFEAKFADRRWRGRGFLLRQVDGACVFLDSDLGGKLRNCRIQPVKPKACDDWTPGSNRPECRAGLARDWHLSVNDAGQIEGSEERLRLYMDFLESLRGKIQ
ncbi:MAG: YkgJ family cysteine cluster protein [Chloroflexi bacterium]|nr:YkgJ family cysteine cluster protein [Chloroflexota bacterium]